VRRLAAIGVILALAIAHGAPAAADEPANIVEVVAQDDRTVITIDRGSNDGVANGWRGRLVKPDGEVVPHVRVTIVRVVKERSVGLVQMTAARVAKGDFHVILRPPPDPPAAIINWWVEGHETLIEIARGSDQGVDAGQEGHLETSDGKVVRHGDFTIDRVTPTTAVAKVRVRAKTIEQGDLRVILGPLPDDD
jgi:hypothetical protein